MSNPIYDNVMVDVEIDPAEQMGHDDRVAKIIATYPSEILKETHGE